MSVASEKEKMLAGELYQPDDPELLAEQQRCRALVRAFNNEEDEAAWPALLRELLGGLGEGAQIRPPLACDFGYNVTLGAGAFVNYGAVILDCAPVTIGAGAQIGPNVQLLAADHPREAGRAPGGARVRQAGDPGSRHVARRRGDRLPGRDGGRGLGDRRRKRGDSRHPRGRGRRRQPLPGRARSCEPRAGARFFRNGGR